MTVFLSTSVSAFGWMTEYYGIKTEQQMETEQIVCLNEEVLQEQLQHYNQVEFTTDIIEVLGVGKHVVHLTDHPFDGATELTIEVARNKIMSVTKGTCIEEDELYREYYTDLDIEPLEANIYQKYKAGKIDPFDEGYQILRSVDGITWTEKFKLIRAGLKAIELHWGDD